MNRLDLLFVLVYTLGQSDVILSTGSGSGISIGDGLASESITTDVSATTAISPSISGIVTSAIPSSILMFSTSIKDITLSPSGLIPTSTTSLDSTMAASSPLPSPTGNISPIMTTSTVTFFTLTSITSPASMTATSSSLHPPTSTISPIVTEVTSTVTLSTTSTTSPVSTTATSSPSPPTTSTMFPSSNSVPTSRQSSVLSTPIPSFSMVERTSSLIPLPSLSHLPQPSLIPSNAPNSTPNPGDNLPLPLIAGAAAGGGFLALIMCIVCIICVVCCVKRKRKYELKTEAGHDGSTTAREYVYEFSDRASTTIFSDKNDEFLGTATTNTFGVKSPTPVEVDVGGQKFVFPDLPSNSDEGEDLPALIIVNPVKPGAVASHSSTLPNRKKRQVHTSDISDAEILIDQAKFSKSTSEINKDIDSFKQPNAEETNPISVHLPDQSKVLFQSPIYDTPRTFKQSKSADKEEKKGTAEYVTMEPPTASVVKPTLSIQSSETINKSAVVDRLAPKLSTSISINVESIYDNPRLIKSKLQITELQKSLTEDSAAHSLYDVPRKLLKKPEPFSTKNTFTEVTPSIYEEKESKIKDGITEETIYDIPKKSTPVSKLSASAVINKVSIVGEQLNEATESKEEHKIDNTQAKPMISLKPAHTVGGTEKELSTMIPLISPKPDSPYTPKESTRFDLPTEASANTKPLLLPKPTSSKETVANKPPVPSKPISQKSKGVSKPEDTINETSQNDFTAEKANGGNESSSSSTTPEPAVNNEGNSIDISSIRKSRPHPKPRKIKQKVGLSQPMMEELVVLQNSKSEDKSSPTGRPATKPKPFVK